METDHSGMIDAELVKNPTMDDIFEVALNCPVMYLRVKVSIENLRGSKTLKSTAPVRARPAIEYTAPAPIVQNLQFQQVMKEFPIYHSEYFSQLMES